MLNPYVELLSKELYKAKVNDNFISSFLELNKPDLVQLNKAIEFINAKAFNFKFSLGQNCIKLRRV
jgi:hypothetical protein